MPIGKPLTMKSTLMNLSHGPGPSANFPYCDLNGAIFLYVDAENAFWMKAY